MRFLSIFALAALVSLSSSTNLHAQGDEGFSRKVRSETQGNERSRQKSLIVMEVDMKPLRLIWVDTPNPQTGELEPKMYIYLCYRAINRPMTAPSVRETEPQNLIDPEPSPPYFIPEFTLVTEDTPEKRAVTDQVLPHVQEAINQKERRKFKNSITIVGPVPPATEEEPNDQNALFGVAIFPGIDPAVDRFTVYMSGFSNGYRTVDGPDGEPILERKTIKQEFWRPGDQFDPESPEFRFQGDPQWIYRPDAPLAEE
ncbi:hypothetical protein [Rubinisphaera sp.]|uniref:hypothetical protein n=1 Tax=Rubinisphaera sp. TaxID=2024857 RepID=UPI000C0DCC4A|nr:hypothetical protein [Rubinisphaera sp.]MBV09019.1 hypothetical protein [Rubinisphaera sp.]HCS53249.1 hypothetical protein [Planctomycetaceae bacterium]|tara:strand:- start:49 stop:816 length:768 start_codon:yes stop_codon:yes gene_type:complete